MAPLVDLGGRTALVTGAAGGIGLAIATAFAALGARVVLSDRAAEAVRDAAMGIGGGAVSVTGDIGSEAGADGVVGAAVEAAGALDILVNNAGVDEPIVRTVDQRLDDWERVMDINLRGTFVVSRAFARHVLGRKAQGAIVNIASARVDRADIEKRLPMRRLGAASEVASVVAFLASDAAAYVTGVTVPVDGGWCAYGGP